MTTTRRMVRQRLMAVGLAAAMAGGAVLASMPAEAQGRPDSLRMSCGQASALVRRSGAVVIGTGAHIYDRFVADHRFCSLNETTVPAFVATRDTPQCFAGYRCTPKQDVHPFGFGWD